METCKKKLVIEHIEMGVAVDSEKQMCRRMRMAKTMYIEIYYQYK
jgi:hypothetical protein